MRYLTKEWVRDLKRIQIIFKATPLGNFLENEKIDFEKLYDKQKKLFLKRENLHLYNASESDSFDSEYFSALFDSVYEQNKKLIEELPQAVKDKLQNAALIPLGYVLSSDKAIIESYATSERLRLEDVVKKADYFTECATDCLPYEIDFDDFKESPIDSVVASNDEYCVKFKNAALLASGVDSVQGDDGIVEKWDKDNQYSGITVLKAVELYTDDEKSFELHLLFENLDGYEKSFLWQKTISCRNVCVR